MVVVDYLGEKIEIEGFPQTFADFNGWVRSRFGLCVSDKISYRNLSDQGEFKYISCHVFIEIMKIIYILNCFILFRNYTKWNDAL